MRQTGTAGGWRLRALRQARGRTQLWVEAEAELGTGYLQRVEYGRVAQPSRGTVERILVALDAHYDEAREVLDAFGYRVAAPLPSPAERAWAGNSVRPALDEVQFPAYALDCTARLIAWNAFLPRLIGMRPEAPLPGDMTDRSLLFSWFDPATRLGATVADPATLYPALARALRYELEHYQGEAWPGELIGALRTLPRFRATWDALANEPHPITATRARVPLRLTIEGTGFLEFHLASEPFAPDPRFRTVYLFPADAAAIRWVMGDG